MDLTSKHLLRPPRLRQYFVRNPLFFVTFNTSNRQPILANDVVHDRFRNFCITAFEKYAVHVGRYVIMPDHVHLFVTGDDNFDLSRWIGQLRRAMGTTINGKGIWQDGFFDHVLRGSESYAEKWEYVRQNPARAGLVAKPEDWMFQGEICDISKETAQR